MGVPAVVIDYTFGSDTDRVAACLAAAYTRQYDRGCVKVWEDLDRYERIIATTAPELLIECGTHTGESARFFSSNVHHVITIDVQDRVTTALPGNVTPLIGSSVDAGVIREVRRIAQRYERVMAVLDSDHSAAHVKAEIAAYGPMVSPGQYLVVEDAIARWMPGETEHGTPYDAIESMLVGNPDWAHDVHTRDLHTVTMFPDGWWKRNASRSV